jgi:hypothetical protein
MLLFDFVLFAKVHLSQPSPKLYANTTPVSQKIPTSLCQLKQANYVKGFYLPQLYGQYC